MRDPRVAGALLSTLLLAAPACPDRPTQERAVTRPATYRVFHGADLVLTLVDEPGALTSTAPPPPGGQVRTHPFLSGSAHDAGHEARLGGLLAGAEDLDAYLALLRAEGYRVERLE